MEVLTFLPLRGIEQSVLGLDGHSRHHGQSHENMPQSRHIAYPIRYVRELRIQYQTQVIANKTNKTDDRITLRAKL